MSAQQQTRTPADDEAAEWIARLGTRNVSLETLKAFAAWRATPANAEAYHRAEQLWSRMGDLSADPEIQSALQSAQKRSPRRIGPKHILAVSLTAAMSASLVIGVFLWQGRGVYETGVGEQRIIQLADGSRIQLDTGSRLKVRFSDGERRIDLSQGQALFEVVHDVSRPFVVSTTDASVTAVGTVFEVRRLSGETRVVLVSGAVDVRNTAADARPQRLHPDQQSSVSAGRARTEPVDAKVATTWKDGELTFVDMPLSEAVAEVNRYLENPIILDAPSIANTSINGVFRTGERDPFVSAAAHLFNLRAVEEAGGQVRLIGGRNNEPRT